eukprot:5963510-Pleurochrysis_carterae.AAC.1
METQFYKRLRVPNVNEIAVFNNQRWIACKYFTFPTKPRTGQRKSVSDLQLDGPIMRFTYLRRRGVSDWKVNTPPNTSLQLVGGTLSPTSKTRCAGIRDAVRWLRGSQRGLAVLAPQLQLVGVLHLRQRFAFRVRVPRRFCQRCPNGSRHGHLVSVRSSRYGIVEFSHSIHEDADLNEAHDQEHRKLRAQVIRTAQAQRYAASTVSFMLVSLRHLPSYTSLMEPPTFFRI